MGKGILSLVFIQAFGTDGQFAAALPKVMIAVIGAIRGVGDLYHAGSFLVEGWQTRLDKIGQIGFPGGTD
jgi:hypothetical protein